MNETAHFNFMEMSNLEDYTPANHSAEALAPFIVRRLFALSLEKKENNIFYHSEYCKNLPRSVVPVATIDRKEESEELNTIQADQISYLLTAILAGLSYFCCGFVAYSIYVNKTLQKHPSWLVFFLSIASIMTVSYQLIWNIGTADFLCYTR